MRGLLNPIIPSSSALTNRVLIRNTSYLSNNSEYSVNNNSSTTNASAIKKRPSFLPQIKTPRSTNVPKNANFDFFQKNIELPISSISTPYIQSSRSMKDMFQIINKADTIVRERMNRHNISFAGGKRHIRSVAISISKGISQKNYTINLLKEQRTKIGDKQRLIDQVIKEFSDQYENDYRRFIDFVAEEKRKQQLEETTMNNLKEKREKKKASLDEETMMNKRLEEAMEKRIKEIYMFKSYGSFLHQVFDKKFSYDKMTNMETRGKNFEKIANDIIYLYETQNKYEDYPDELNDVEKLMKTYILFEDKILMALKNKDLAINEITKQKQMYKKEIEQIKLSLIDYENDYKYLKKEKHNVFSEIKNFKISQNETLETILSCIIELGKDIGTECPIPPAMDKEHLIEFSIYVKKTLNQLRNTEAYINDLINEIESTVEFGDLEDKILMEKCIGEQKKINKKEKQLKIKMIQEELKNQKNLRALKRANKIVIGGRKAPMIVNMRNKLKKIKFKSHDKMEAKVDIYDVNDNEDESEEV